MTLAELMRRRRMVHQFEPRLPPRDLIDTVLEAALHAPSGGFSQGFAMVVIDDPERVRWFHEATSSPDDPAELRDLAAARPPVIAIAMCNPSIYTERYSRADKEFAGLQSAESWAVPYWWVDAGMAVMLILLAAVENGLGAWFYGLHVAEDELRMKLGLPDGFLVVGVIGLGYKASEDRKLGSSVTIPRRRFEEVVRRTDPA